MPSIAELLSLQDMSGLELLDKAAMLTGLPVKPSAAAEPLISVRPADLDALSQDWAKIADFIDEHRVDLQVATDRVLGNWQGHAADDFARYVAELLKVVENQQEAMRSIQPLLSEMKNALDSAKDSADQAIQQAALAIIGIIAAGLVGIAVSALVGELTAPIVIGAVITAVLGVLFAILGALLAIQASRDNTLKTLSEQLQRLEELATKDNVKQVSPPLPPVITAPSFRSSEFYSEHQPPHLRPFDVTR